MTRIVAGLAVLLLLSACASDGGSGGSGSADAPGSASAGGADDASARTVKAEVDGEAEAVLPDLVERLGGRLNGMQAAFTERGGYDVWDYTASGSLAGPTGTATQSLDSAADVLEEHGYTVETDDSQKRVTGTKGDVSVMVEASLLTAEDPGAGLNLRMGSIDGVRDDAAADAPPEDYLAYVG